MNPDLDVVVIGAGHAGLSISYHLKRLGLNHLVLEKDRIGSVWLNQRWDSFRFNSPNAFNLLPGQEKSFGAEEGFCSVSEFVSFLQQYAESNQLPVRENCEVIAVDQLEYPGLFEISVLEKDRPKMYRCRQVVAASGGQNKKVVPLFAPKIVPKILQLHSGEYKNPASLPEGGVLIVGCAQSGIQIAEDLLQSGRRVYVSTCRTGRLPRRYRGKDIFYWLSTMGMFDTLTDEVADPNVFTVRQPQISGLGQRGHTVSLQSLAGSGAVILGKMKDAENSVLTFMPDAVENMRYADEFSAKMKEIIDLYIEKSRIDAPPAEEDPADIPSSNPPSLPEWTSVDLTEHNIRTVIWATGFTGEFNYLHFPVFDEKGNPKHRNGISEIGGLYFIGLPWMRKRKSGIINGIMEDAEYISGKIEAFHHSLTLNP